EPPTAALPKHLDATLPGHPEPVGRIPGDHVVRRTVGLDRGVQFQVRHERATLPLRMEAVDPLHGVNNEVVLYQPYHSRPVRQPVRLPEPLRRHCSPLVERDPNDPFEERAEPQGSVRPARDGANLFSNPPEHTAISPPSGLAIEHGDALLQTGEDLLSVLAEPQRKGLAVA